MELHVCSVNNSSAATALGTCACNSYLSLLSHTLPILPPVAKTNNPLMVSLLDMLLGREVLLGNI